MSSQPQPSDSNEVPPAERRAWLKPGFARLDTAEAEAADGTGSDSSGFVS